MDNLYEFNSVPLKIVTSLKHGDKCVDTYGDVYWWDGLQLILDVPSPLDNDLENNTVENLTETQLNLFWKLCK